MSINATGGETIGQSSPWVDVSNRESGPMREKGTIVKVSRVN